MRRWTFALGGLLVGTGHFFLSYVAASLFPGSPFAKLLTILITIAALVASALLLRQALRKTRLAADDFDRWIGRLAAGSAAISLVAILWQGLPPLFA